MKKFKHRLRILFWAGFVLLLVFIILPIFYLFYLFNQDQVKQELQQQFAPQIKLVVTGNVFPQFWHGLSIQASNISVFDDKDKQLLQIGTLNCQLSWLDLALGHYKIKRVSLNHVQVYENNLLSHDYADLFQYNHTNQNLFNSVKVIKIDQIKTATESAPYKISEGSIKVSLNSVAPVVNFSFNLPTNGTYVAATAYLSGVKHDHLDFNNVNFHVYGKKFNLNFNAKASYQLQTQHLNFSNVAGTIELNNYLGNLLAESLIVMPDKILLNNTNIKLQISNDLANQNIDVMANQIIIANLDSLLINLLKVNYSATILQNKINILSSFKQVAIDRTSNVTTTSCNNEINLSLPQILNNKLSATLNGVCEYIAAGNVINLNLVGRLNTTPMQIDLQLLNTQNKPKLVIAGKIDTLDLSKVNKSKFLPLYYDNSKLPFAWLSLIDMDADLLIKNFAFDRMNLTNVVTDFNISNNTLHVKGLKADIYDGLLSGSGKISNNNNSYTIALHEHTKNLSLEKLFKDLFDVEAISGRANMDVNIVANNVVSYEDVHKNLSGNVNIQAQNGKFQGVNFNILGTDKNLNLNSDNSTAFDNLIADFHFIEGISTNGTLAFHSPYIVTSGKGVVDFVNTRLDYNLMIKSALPQNNQKINSVEIPVSANGDLFDPHITIQNIHLSTTSPSTLSLRHKHKTRNSHHHSHLQPN